MPFPRGLVHNPFSSERVRPGALPFLLPPGETVAGLLARFVAAGRRGQIVGPEGTGKSTLLAALAAEARGQGLAVEEALALEPRLLSLAAPGALLVVEGGEQLSARSWRILRARCDALDADLLAATHRDLGLPTLWRPAPDLALARRITARLLEGWPLAPPPDDLLAQLLRQRHGNMRLVLFDLYDWYEEQARGE